MFFNILVFMVAFLISGVSAFYSVTGLINIFSAASWSVMVMGGALELGKVTAVVWLHKYWNRAGWQLKVYLVPAVIILMLITAMGTYGYLAKAHSDQALVSGDVTAKVAVYDTKIQTAKENITEDRKSLQQLDTAVDQVMGRSTDVNGAEKSASIRKSQAKERARLSKEIELNQTSISQLNEQAGPIRAQIRKVEADVGPIKYIAALIYGDNPSADLLERAVRWVIILIVFVFDPLALTLVIAATTTYGWMDEDEKAEKTIEATAEKTIEDTENLDGFKEELSTAFAPYPDEKFEGDNQIWSEYFEKNDFSKTFMKSRGTVDPDINLESYNPIEVQNPEEVEDVKTIQTDDINLDGEIREDVPEEHPPIADEPDVLLEQPEDQVEQRNEVIKTEGVTLNQIGEDYVEFKGKSVRKQALAMMHPEMFAARPIEGKSNANFGSSFPQFAAKGDIFVRVDVLPNRVYKFDGTRWMEINKDFSDSYIYDEEYIKHLVKKIEIGEYDVELLSENEKAQIENYLSKNNT